MCRCRMRQARLSSVSGAAWRASHRRPGRGQRERVGEEQDEHTGRAVVFIVMARRALVGGGKWNGTAARAPYVERSATLLGRCLPRAWLDQGFAVREVRALHR